MKRRAYQKIEVDVHNMTVAEAKKHLERTIAGANPGVKEIVVIHGYHGGNKIADMIKTTLKSKRILQKLQSFANPGVTTIILKDE